MISGLEKVKSKRSWFVESISVWGLAQEGQIDFAVVENTNSTLTLLFANQSIGSSLQTINFSDLTDHRGNQLPATMDSPRILIRPRSETAVFIVGQESDQSFKIARDSDASGPVTVDLMVIEMGS